MSAMTDRQSNGSKSGLMILPYELRAPIYEDVINGETSPPKDQYHVDSGRSQQHFHMMKAFYRKHYRHSSSSLLQTSKQIHDEVRALLDTEHQRQHQRPKCKLDIIATRPNVWPTWIRTPIPRFSGPYDLDVELRLFDVVSPMPLFTANGWPGIIGEPLMVILNRILAYGPQLSQSDPNFPGLEVSTLTMNIRHCVSDQAVSEGPRKKPQRGSGRGDLVETAFSSLLGFMQRLERQGVLVGRVVQMTVVCEKLGRSATVLVEDREHETERVCEFWEKHGFKWGPDPNTCCRPPR